MSLLNQNVAVATVRVKGFCEGFNLTPEAYMQLLIRFPGFRDYIESVSRMRLRETEGQTKHEEKGSRSTEVDHQRLAGRASERSSTRTSSTRTTSTRARKCSAESNMANMNKSMRRLSSLGQRYMNGLPSLGAASPRAAQV